MIDSMNSHTSRAMMLVLSSTWKLNDVIRKLAKLDRTFALEERKSLDGCTLERSGDGDWNDKRVPATNNGIIIFLFQLNTPEFDSVLWSMKFEVPAVAAAATTPDISKRQRQFWRRCSGTIISPQLTQSATLDAAADFIRLFKF
jgi:hypothetical protein